jgi:hypothetical protein
MPAKDIYHDAVVNALRKDGWTIVTEQYTLGVDEKRVWIDIRAARENLRRIILIEVKSFHNLQDSIEALANAIGKYALYSAIIEIKDIREDLFLAIPRLAYEGIFRTRIAQNLLKREKVKLIVFDVENEEILQWIE